MLNEKQIEKTNWFYRYSKEENLFLENIELELNIYEHLKFDLTVIYYESGFDQNIEKLFIHQPSNENIEPIIDEKDYFSSKYYHFLLVGKCEIEHNSINNILFKIDKIITNDKTQIDEKNAHSFECMIDNSYKILTLNKTSFINEMIKIKNEIILENMS